MLDQLVVGAAPGAPITTSAMLIQGALSELGPSELFAQHIEPGLAGTVRPLAELAQRLNRGRPLVFHASMGSWPVYRALRHNEHRLVLVYHNFSPAEFYADVAPEVAGDLIRGRWELEQLRDRVELAIADSDFNAAELVELGYRDVGVIAPTPDIDRLDRTTPDPRMLARLSAEVPGPLVLCVAQQLPHKRIERVLAAVAVLQQEFRPDARLAFVGVDRVPTYSSALRVMARSVGLRDPIFTGRVSDEELSALYLRASVFTTLSEHEGFCVPVVEAMATGVPAVVSRRAAIPSTVGDAAVLVDDPDDPVAVAGVLDRVIGDDELRMTLIGRGVARARSLAAPATLPKYLALLTGLPAEQDRSGSPRVSVSRASTVAGASERPADTSAATSAAAPGWFEALVAGAATVPAAGGVVGLAAALSGGYRTLPVVAISLLAGAVVAAGVARLRSGIHVARSAHLAAGAAVVIAVVFTAWASWAPSHHVLINRDPGSYTTTARWLVRDGGLDATARAGGLEDQQLLRTDGAAVYDVGDGRVEFQFTHLTAVALAAAYELGGPGALFRLPAFASGLGLLALYAVAVRATGRRTVALVAPALLAVSLPMVFVSRDTYSEPFAFALVWSSVLVGLLAAERGRPWAWSVSGLLGGAALAARPDLVVTLVVLGPLLVLHLSTVRRVRSGRSALADGASFGVGLGMGALIAGLDLWTASGGYADRHGGQIAIGAVAAVVATGVVAVEAVAAPSRLDAIRDRWIRHRVRLVVPVVLVGVAALLAAWWLRPELQVMTGPDEVPLIGGMQAAEGLAVEPDRRYSEYSMVWMSWYLGAGGLIAAIAGFGVALARSVNGAAGRALVVVTALFAGVGAVTLWRPVITPDQVWASRRFVPVVLPSLAVLVAVAVGALLAAGAVAPAVRRTLAGVVVAVALLGAAATTWPVRSLREQHGYRAVLEEACGLVGDDASVVVLGRPEADALPQAMRSWCGVPAAAAANGVGAQDLDPVIGAIRDEGRTPVLVSRDPDALRAPAGGTVESTAVAVETRHAERTLMRPPSSYAEPGDRWSLSVRRLGP